MIPIIKLAAESFAARFKQINLVNKLTHPASNGIETSHLGIK